MTQGLDMVQQARAGLVFNEIVCPLAHWHNRIKALGLKVAQLYRVAGCGQSVDNGVALKLSGQGWQ